MSIRAVAVVYDPEWSGAWPFGSPLATRMTAQLASAGYQVTAIETVKANTLENLLSFVDAVRVDLTMTPTTGETSTVAVTEKLRTIIVSATGYPPASIAIVSAGQAAPAPVVSAVDTIAGNLANTLTSISQGSTIITWAIVIGVVALVYQIAAKPGSVRKWIA